MLDIIMAVSVVTSHFFLKRLCLLFYFQIWKCEESLDRDLFFCGAAGREVHQVQTGLVIHESFMFLDVFFPSLSVK